MEATEWLEEEERLSRPTPIPTRPTPIPTIPARLMRQMITVMLVILGLRVASEKLFEKWSAHCLRLAVELAVRSTMKNP